MIKQEPLKLWFVAIILIAFMSTWAIVSNSQNEAPSSVVPMVTATSPVDGATGVTINQPISVSFSQAMSAPSMAANLILQRTDGTLVNGTVTTVGRTTLAEPKVRVRKPPSKAQPRNESSAPDTGPKRERALRSCGLGRSSLLKARSARSMTTKVKLPVMTVVGQDVINDSRIKAF